MKKNQPVSVKEQMIREREIKRVWCPQSRERSMCQGGGDSHLSNATYGSSKVRIVI